MIQRWKDRGLTPDRGRPAEDTDFAGGRARELYAAYQAGCATLNAADFGDLLLHVTEILRTQPDVLAQYHRMFRYILVDEYQDTNLVQYLWLRLLAQGHRNICCVGDDDQSIYSWRGAEVENILRFEKDFEGAKIVRLEAQLPLDRADPGRRVGADRAQRGPARQDAAPRAQRCAAGREGRAWSACGTPTRRPAWSATAIEALRRDGHAARRDGDPGARRLPDPRVRGAADHARHAVSRGRRPALLRARRRSATPSPICA